MASIDWSVVDKFIQDNPVAADFLDVIKPYLPTLARQSPDVWEGFLKHAMNSDWESIDKALYAQMTHEERLKLDKEVIDGVRAAAQAKFDRHQLAKEILKDVITKSLLRVVLAAMVP